MVMQLIWARRSNVNFLWKIGQRVVCHGADHQNDNRTGGNLHDGFGRGLFLACGFGFLFRFDLFAVKRDSSGGHYWNGGTKHAHNFLLWLLPVSTTLKNCNELFSSVIDIEHYDNDKPRRKKVKVFVEDKYELKMRGWLSLSSH
jgi:hypothetical protein